MADPAEALARRLGWTSGQVWTAGVCSVAGSALFLALLPSALHPRSTPLTTAGSRTTGPVPGLTLGEPAPPVADPAAAPAGPSAGPSGAAPSASPVPDASGSPDAGGSPVPGVAPVDGAPPVALPVPGATAGGAPASASPGPSGRSPSPAPSRSPAPGGTSRPTPSRSSASPTPTTPGRPTTSPSGPTGPATAAPVGGSVLGAALTVTGSGWTAMTGTPGLAAATAADGQLPVGAVAGSSTSRAFVRLTGSGAVLHLPATTSDPTGGAAAGTASAAAVALCVNTSAAWVDGPAQADGPPYDERRCVSGVPSSDQADWAFDLAALPPTARTSAEGFTVVRDPATTGRTFQLVFAPGSTT